MLSSLTRTRRRLLLALLVLTALAASACVSRVPAEDRTPKLVTTLAVLKGRTEVQSMGTDRFSPGQTGRALVAGDRVRTASEGTALITFFDGSTITLEPQTEVVIFDQRLGGGNPSGVRLAIRQPSGTTWLRAEPAPGAAFQFDIAMPGGAATLDAAATVEVAVSQTGPSIVRSIRGSVQVHGGWGELAMPAGHELSLPRGGTPDAALPLALPFHRFTLSLEPPARAWLRVIDGAGRSAGAVAPGLPVDQMPGAFIGTAEQRSQIVVLTRVQPGKYTILLEPTGDGSVGVALHVESEGQTLFNDIRRAMVQRDRPLAATLEVQGQGNHLTSATLGVFSPVRTELPGTVVRTLAAIELVARRAAREPAPAIESPDAATPSSESSTARTRQIPSATPTATRTATITPTPTATATPAPSATPLPTAAPVQYEPPPQPEPPTPTRTATRPASVLTPFPATATPASPQRLQSAR